MPDNSTPAAAAQPPHSKPPADAETLARALPKVLLHEHLDGGLRVSTLLQAMRARGLPLPSAAGEDEQSLAAWFDRNAHAGSLEKYLEGFALTVAAMASPAMLEQVACEAAADAAADGVLLAEFRIAPLLFEPHGLAGEAVVEALLAGLARSPLPLGSGSGLIVCAMRQLPPEETARAAALAVRYAGQGVVGFDLAGPEAGFPPTPHAASLERVLAAGLGLTLHAGEADAAPRVLEAARLGATRIGHGVRLVDALQGAPGSAAPRALVDEAIARGLHLEVCPTSNVHTGAAPSIAEHPITALWHAGLSLSYHTDNRLMSCISPSGEAAALLQHTPLTAQDLLEMALQAAQHSFLPAPARAAAVAAIRAQGAALGIASPRSGPRAQS